MNNPQASADSAKFVVKLRGIMKSEGEDQGCDSPTGT